MDEMFRSGTSTSRKLVLLTSASQAGTNSILASKILDEIPRSLKDVQTDAMFSLRFIGDGSLSPGVAGLLTEEMPPEFQAAALEFLGMYGGPECLPIIVAHLENGVASVRAWALAAALEILDHALIKSGFSEAVKEKEDLQVVDLAVRALRYTLAV